MIQLPVYEIQVRTLLCYTIVLYTKGEIYMANDTLNCPLETTMDVIGGKWKSVILFHLLDGKLRFGELKRYMPTITQRMLTRQLRQLEKDGLVHRKVYAQVPPKVEYALTDLGCTLKPILILLNQWGQTYITPTISISGSDQN
jgi:DNA-binding HxlR family transcriptional regulator